MRGWQRLYIMFMVIGSFIMLNLFVGAVVDNFNRLTHKEASGGLLLTDSQKLFVSVGVPHVNHSRGD